MKKPTQAVYICWVDSVSQRGWTRTLDTWCLECSSIGWLLEEDEEAVIISASMANTSDRRGSEQQYDADAPMRIPRCTITRMHIWKPPAWVILD